MAEAITREERAAIQESFRRLLADHCKESDVRRVMETPLGYDAALWQRMADMGITGLLIDTAYGGVGGGPQELELIMEEAGAALLASPFLGSSVLAASLIAGSSDGDAKARLLPGIANGSRIAAAALTGDNGLWTREDVAVKAHQQDNACRLNGVASYVIAAENADTLLVAAQTERGLAVFEVARNAPGVGLAPLKTLDMTLRLSRLTLKDAVGTPVGGADGAVIERALDMARVALAGDQVGGARRIFEVTIDYAKTRVQFGRVIGGFQAIKHMAADLLLEVESATSAARYAAQALADGAIDTRQAVSLAAFACADAYSQVAATAVQMHGGIAFTWDHPAHLYLRRARADAHLFGSSAFYRERYVVELEKAE